MTMWGKVNSDIRIEPMQALYEKHRKKFQPLLLIMAFALVFLIGWLRFLTGPEYSFSFIFLLLIIMVTWMVGKYWGMLISVVSAFSWLMADLFMIDRFSISFIPLINEFFRLLVFLFVVLMIARHKKILIAQKELAMMDPLTGVANRRAFFHLAKTEIDRSRRYKNPFSVIFIDIDDFKQINDLCGHQTGDRLLIAVVETIKLHVRAIDIIARFGGDEFVVLLVNSEKNSAALVARKLQKQLLDIMHKNQWGVTFSIGVATYHSAPDSVDEAIKAADELMYHVKHNGKNNIRQAVLKA